MEKGLFQRYQGGSCSTASGRTSRPSRRAKSYLAESMSKGFLALYTETLCTTRDLELLITITRDPSVDDLEPHLDEWHALRSQLMQFHQDLPRHLEPPELELCRKDMEDLIPYLERVDELIDRFLAPKGEASRSSKPDDKERKALKQEFSKLEEEFQRSLLQYRREQSTSPSPGKRARLERPRDQTDVKTEIMNTKESPRAGEMIDKSRCSPRQSRYEMYMNAESDRKFKMSNIVRTVPTLGDPPAVPPSRVPRAMLNEGVLRDVLNLSITVRGFKPLFSGEREVSTPTSPRSRSVDNLSFHRDCYRAQIANMNLDSIRTESRDRRYTPRDESTPASHAPPEGSADHHPLLPADDSPRRMSARAMLAVAEAMLEQKKTDTLPKIEPPTFSGDPLQFTTWKNSFEIMVGSRVSGDREKLHYLYKYTEGKVRDMVEGYMNVADGESAFERAKTAVYNRYGNRMIIADAYKSKITRWPRIQEGDGPGLARFSDFLWQCYHVMQGSVNLDILNTQEESLKIVAKLPFHLRTRWFREVDKAIFKNRIDSFADLGAPEGDYPCFHELCKFLSYEARVANGPCSSLSAPTRDAADPPKRSFLIESEDRRSQSTGRPTPRCGHCKEAHYLYQCESFLNLPVRDRKDFAMRRGLCFGCLRRDHRVFECTIKNARLMAPGPNDPPRHSAPTTPASATEVPEEATRPKEQATTCNARAVKNPNMYTYVVPVKVFCRANPERGMIVFAAVDNQSDCSFITDRVAKRIGAKGYTTCLELRTITNVEETDCTGIEGLLVRGVDGTETLTVPLTYTKPEIPIGMDCIPTPEVLRRVPHLRDLEEKIIQPRPGDRVEMLIGYNCARTLLSLESRHQDGSSIFASRSPLGWAVMGSEGEGGKTRLSHCFRTSARELTRQDLIRAFDGDFEYRGQEEHVKMSAEDVRFLKIVKEGITQTEEGKFQIPLPMKKEAEGLKLPGKESRRQAVGSVRQTGRKMKRDPAYGKRYKESMKKTIDNHAERVPYPDPRDPDTVFYWSHHGVDNPKKDKLRTVFNGSREILGVALNDLLLTGPDLTNNLIGVLLRFRLEIIAILCDIEGMFHQVLMTPWFRDFVRFVWFLDGDPDGPIVDYRMKAHLFGASSSPGCANYALKEAARRFEHKYGPEAAQFLRNNFYVDDGLGNVTSVDEAEKLIRNSRGMCAEGGFNLCKFDSNSKELLDRIPDEWKAKKAEPSSIGATLSPPDCALGVAIDLKEDKLRYHFEPKPLESTRRGYLSGLSAVYDPLGLIGPAILPGRVILQKLCAAKLEWDEELEQAVQETWDEWYGQLQDLNQIAIDRCVKKKLKGEILYMEIHTFVDASTLGLGICIYLVQRTADDYQSALIFGKSKVAPLKPTTMPRMELQAAVLGVQATVFIKEQLMKGNVSEYYYSDSKIVLAYICNLGLRCHMYVNNRAGYIRSKSEPRQWRYVNTETNPADLASRGVTVKTLIESQLWWEGPAFLAQRHTEEPEHFSLSPEDPEVKKGQHAGRCFMSLSRRGTVDATSMVEEVSQKMSAWHSLLRWFSRVAGLIFRGKKQTPTAIEKQQLAERLIWRNVQMHAFPHERKLLENTSLDTLRGRNSSRDSPMKPLPRDSPLYKLNPFMDEHGLIRVGGRIQNGDYPVEYKHPCILPRTSAAVMLKVRQLHQEAGHPGTNWTLGATRTAGLWIIQGRSMVNSMVRRCVRCTKKRRPAEIQRMGELPAERLSEGAPFTYSAVDLFGPFEVKFSARSTRKRWIAIFVCLSCRGVHMEVVDTLETCSFLNAYRRFTGRRGPVRGLWSDRGTNFIGADREMELEKRKMLADPELKAEIEKGGCDFLSFHFNFPKASHMGGAWERMIRTVRSAMFHALTIHEGALSEDQLKTVVVENEAIVNSRPVTYVDSQEVDEPVPISPAQLLTLKSDIAAPLPGIFPDTDRYAKKRWRYVQYLAQQFWERWRREMIPKMQTREKWQKRRPNLGINDVVLMIEDGVTRGKWPMARVLETYPGDDGIVRKVKIRVRGTELERPITKLVKLLDAAEAPSPADDDIR